MISIQNLSKRFGDYVAVDNLSLDVKQGEFFCFLGPNGAGKTTTIKMLIGLLHPTEGSASVGGHDIQREPEQAKAILGYIPDTPFLYEKLTGWEFMEFIAGVYRLDGSWRDRAAELMRQFGVAHAADRLIDGYSHGMRQKLSFASCFLHEPQVVVVDEPWVGLDPRNIRFVKNFLREKTEQGVTVFMSTHSLPIIEDVADRAGIIRNGRLLRVGRIAEILALARKPGTLEDVFLELTEEEDAEAAS
jgi:ABC-2 type transport system ATP-binding protein